MDLRFSIKLSCCEKKNIVNFIFYYSKSETRVYVNKKKQLNKKKLIGRRGLSQSIDNRYDIVIYFTKIIYVFYFTNEKTYVPMRRITNLQTICFVWKNIRFIRKKLSVIICNTDIKKSIILIMILACKSLSISIFISIFS